MPAFVEKYSQTQRDALAHAYEDKRIRPARRVVQLAGAGELSIDGETLPAFKTNEDTVRHEARRLRKRRAGEVKSDLATQPPRDAVEALRQRLVNMADAELAHLEKQKPGKRDPEKIRQAARAVLEIARIPGPTEPRPASPATRDENGKRGPETKGGMAGTLIKAHRATTTGTGQRPTKPAQDDTNTATHHRDNTHHGQHTTEQHHDTTDEQPGSWARRQAEQLSRAQG